MKGLADFVSATKPKQFIILTNILPRVRMFSNFRNFPELKAHVGKKLTKCFI